MQESDKDMKHWYCIFTKPRQADVVAQKLILLPEIEVFTPKLKRNKVRRGSYTEVIEELFPSYIFSRFSLERYAHMIRYTRGVRRIVGDTEGYPITVDERIIRTIQENVQDGFVVITPPDLKTGDPVRVTDGPFAGLAGIFLKELKPRDRIVILLNAIHYQARVQVAPYQVERT